MKVVSVHKNATHSFSKQAVDSITLIENEGVEGDAHRGVNVKHRYLVKKDPNQPNLRQVHLIQQELIEALRSSGYDVSPGVMGENITTEGVDLLNLPQGTRLIFSGGTKMVASGIRTPCSQLNHYQEGLTSAMIERDENNQLVFKSGIFAMIEKGGEIRAGESIEVILPPQPHVKLESM